MRDGNPAIDLSRRLRMSYRDASRAATEAAMKAAHITTTRQRTQATKDGLVRPLIGQLEDLDDEVRTFFRTDFRQAYAQGARHAFPDWKPTSGDIDRVRKMAEDTSESLLQNNTAAKRGIRQLIPGFVDMPRPEAVKAIRKKPFKGRLYANGAQVPFDSYAEMTLRSSVARAYNLGYINSALDNGARFFQVSDGPDCHWISHTQGDPADGLIVSAEEAQAQPIAHPNCVRSFIARWDLHEIDESIFRRGAKAAGRTLTGVAKATAAENAISLVHHLAADERVQDAARRVISAGRADFLQYKQNLQAVARLYEYARRTRLAELGNVTDIATAQTQKVSSQMVADDVMAWIDDFADGEEVPEHVLQIIGVEKKDATRIAVGDRLDGFTTMYNSTFRTAGPVRLHPVSFRIPTKVIGGVSREVKPKDIVMRALSIPPNLTSRQRVERFASTKFFDWLGPKIPQSKYLRMTFPNINGSIGFLDRPHRVSGSLGDLVKVTRTSIRDRGVINHISLNPNGLIRLGLTRDPVTKLITPTFRLIPPGPLHIMTRVNRGVHGNITSLSGEVRLITKTPIGKALSARFNLNLRKLGLETLGDIKKLKIEDFRKFDIEDLRGVSLAADLRLRGYNLFDISRTFRLPWEEAQKLWKLSEFELDEILADLKAEKARKKLRIIQGGRPTIGPLPPDTGSVPPRPILRIVDPVTGDPFGPGGRPSFAQRISVPGNITKVPDRREYIRSKLSQAEKARVENLRLAGDTSTIRHLRDRDKLTWEQIAAEMNMTENKVRKIYKEGTK